MGKPPSVLSAQASSQLETFESSLSRYESALEAREALTAEVLEAERVDRLASAQTNVETAVAAMTKARNAAAGFGADKDALDYMDAAIATATASTRTLRAEVR